ncbi:glycoprotein H [Alcelaphine gammaherpesvirus 1]|uniref:Envelope glycoprotein H n=1 Tax=Alcelaphine herpesvirus 1 (strain C500) TaxID=654901 RepID=GH_ALHV1|nr:glycoprotein H [Alcelaphine gammaherpesvirus 1]O36372.1 RecName: Full=Envelope glycoprotein H; Short=gH; Flags: Precursor [Alcelaphine herpesvirus 1 strain C500]AAC58069.1 glycoprotein H [Alcelaphine gammaherpesvirus 1]APB09448.1 envelope glycoprotein H [Alcelaphine gammaherpesvirus 1]APB09520.1 envelope glycoprotein H [Alcelaphine gammaherpesvirus 1]
MLFLILLCVTGAQAITTPAPPRPATTTPRRGVTSAPLIVPASSSELIVTLDGTFHSVTIDMTEIRQYVRQEIIEALWNASHVFESLETTYNRYKDVYRFTDQSIRVNTRGKLSTCKEVNKSTEVSFYKSITSQTINGKYDGDLGISNHQLGQQLFFYVMNVFPVENAFYPVRKHVVYSSLSLADGAYQLAGMATTNYVSLVVVRKISSTVTHEATIVFGNKKLLPSMRGSITKYDISLVNSDAEELLLLTSQKDYEYFSKNLFPQNWTDVFSLITSHTVGELAQILQTSVVDFARKGRCRSVHFNSHFLTTYLAVLSLYYKMGTEFVSKNERQISLQCILPKLYEANVCFDMVHRCFTSQYTRGFDSDGINRLSAAILGSMPFEPNQGLSVPTNWFLQTLYFVDGNLDPQNKGLHGITLILMDIYGRYVVNFTLTPEDRETLFYVYNALRGRKHLSTTMKNKYVSLIYCYTTSMCSATELAWGIEYWGEESTHSAHHSFSPCFMSLRFDYTLEKLNIEGSQDVKLTQTQLSNGVSAMYSLLTAKSSTWTIDSLSIKPCIYNASFVKMIVPFTNVSYVISQGVAAPGTTYDVAETFLKSSMVITVVSNSECYNLTASKEILKIPVVYNMTHPRIKCQLCDSVVISYDEYDGLQTMVYISNYKVQQDLFSDYSIFFDFNNMHTHYLLLMNNGTLFEIRGLYANRAMNIIIILLFTIAALAGVFIVYKIVMYMTFK